MEAKAVDHEIKIAAEIRAVEDRKASVEAKLAASQDALKVIGDQIAERDAELTAAIATRNDDLARATAEGNQRLAQINRDISAAEDRLATVHGSLKKTRELLGN
jgi:chromosome segregation ATPase